MAKNQPVILWFRQDLRLSDNPALHAAVETGAPLIPIYILDDLNAGDWAIGGASRWWLHQSLTALNVSLDGKLQFFRGQADELLPAIVRREKARAVFWNRCYEPWRKVRDQKIKALLRDQGVEVKSCNSALVHEPHHVTKDDGNPYKVFTPFFRKHYQGEDVMPLVTGEQPQKFATAAAKHAVSLDELQLLPQIPWYREMAQEWQPGESGAHQRLDEFLTEGIKNYAEGRNRPDLAAVSRLSPHLHFGELSPRQAWAAASPLQGRSALQEHVQRFLTELGWREFSYSLLYHWPTITTVNLQDKFDRFPWREDDAALTCWQHGRTGYPIVDAGMRELWRTGYMHNRVRMLVGSFLVKNLLLHWHFGEAWFWDTLLDADLANNSASWQWIAGCGADAAPYFRIFNPVTQGKKFDPDGRYVARFVPELARLPARYIHSPWTAPAEELQRAGVELGDNYPMPIVDLAESRQRALDAFKSLSAG